MEITSKPEQIDEIDRKILQLEMEKLSLGRESDSASQERLQRIERELAELGEQQSNLNAQWQQEKGAIDEISSLKEDMERVQLQVDQAKRSYDLNKAAELEYGTLATLQSKLQEKEVELAAEDGSDKTLLREEVTEDDIAEVKWRNCSNSKPICIDGDRPRPSRDSCRRCDSAIQGWAERSQQAHCQLSFSRPHGRRQDRTLQGPRQPLIR